MVHVSAQYSRGQALFETLFFTPLIITGIFMVMWAGREVVTLDRLQSTLRYSGSTVATSNLFTELTISQVYVGSYKIAGLPANPTCAAPPKQLLHGTDSTSGPGMLGPLNGISIQRSSYFAVATADITTSCSTAIDGIAAGGGFSRDLLLLANTDTVTSNVPVTGLLPGIATSVQATTTFFRQPDLAELTACFPDVQSAIHNSLYVGALANPADGQPLYDASDAGWDTPVDPPTTPLTLSGSCLTAAGPHVYTAPPANIDTLPPQNPAAPNLGEGHGNPPGTGASSAEF